MSHETNKRIVLAGFLIVIGIVLLLRNLGFVSFFPWYLFSWPMIFVLVGIFIILTKRAVLPGIIFIGLGLYFILPDMFGLYFERFWMLWPIILVAVGMSLLLRNRSYDHDRRSRENPNDGSMDYLDELTIFGGGEKIINSQNFKGGRITTIFGGSEINLLNTKLSKGVNYIDIVSLFGGCTLIIPPTWNVKVDMISIFAGFSDIRSYSPQGDNKGEPELIIKGVTIFGGGEIKSMK